MKYYYLAIILLLFSIDLSSQSFSGKVIGANNSPIAYALIYCQKHNIHAHTTEDGSFTIGAFVGDTLELSHLSYKKSLYVISDLAVIPDIIMVEENINLDEIVISNDINAINKITAINLKLNPVNSSQEILMKLPGLFIGQHAGGGKAEQIFLRGFDIDHGTDIAISADGIPVNMVSHAHGQGYADLHFLIPETIENIDFGLGPHHADQGNFATAGYVDFKTKKALESSLLKVELGQNNTKRIVSLLDVNTSEKNHSYIAAEHMTSDGPFVSPQNFSRTNVLVKHTTQLTESTKLSLSLSHFNSNWKASGQIPQREVDKGTITRFGAIDDTEGGTTARSNLILDFSKYLSKTSQLKNKFYFSKYDFELYSNFTFFLNDSINGDQIKQRENRYLYGLSSEYLKSYSSSSFDANIKAGLTLRSDLSSNNQLAHTLNRSTVLNNIRLGNVVESNLASYIDLTFDFGKFMINPSFRIDNFNFAYEDLLTNEYTVQSVSKTISSPKLGLYYSYSKTLQVFAKLGKGFHSNDSRVASTSKELETIPSAYGYDLGAIWKAAPNLFINATYWSLYLQQEFVYVGDEGIVEPSGRTERKGVDLAMNYQPIKWLLWNINFNYTKPRALDEQEGNNYIPLAPSLTLMSGMGLKHPSGLGAQLNFRYLGDRAATEDYLITAEGYTVVDLSLNYSIGKVSCGLQIQNLLDTEWNETQFATESRLQFEDESTTEIHFTPGTPLFIKGSLEYQF